MTDDNTHINTTFSKKLLISLKVLAAQNGKRMRELLEEAVTDLLEKYSNK